MVSSTPHLLALLLFLTAGAAAFRHQYIQDKPYSQEFRDNFNILKYLGGNGPYSNGRGFGIDRETPESCQVEQVILLMRHGERYPDPSTYTNIAGSLKKLTSSNITFKDDLSFVNSWDFPINDISYLAQETYTGAYGGLLDGYNRGTVYGARYGHLWDGKSQIPIFSSGYERIIETARKFGEGFFGYNYSDVVNLNIISENGTQGANSLTPVCYNTNSTAGKTCASLTSYMPQFDVAAARLNGQNPGLKLNSTDIFNIMQMVGYELGIRANSPWINVFTQAEWQSFGYVVDLFYYYCYGAGDADMLAVGSVYANATLKLLEDGPSSNKSKSLYFSFCHDINITPILATLGFFTPDKDLPTDGSIPFHHSYSSGDFVPMGGHLLFERLNCNKTAVSEAGTYVRAVVNEAVYPIDSCSNGPGFSCGLKNYTSYVNDRLKDFNTDCKVPAQYPQELTFFWQYNESKQYNYQQGPISYQLGLTNV